MDDLGQAVVEWLTRNPGSTTVQIARALDVSRAKAGECVRALREAKRLRSETVQCSGYCEHRHYLGGVRSRPKSRGPWHTVHLCDNRRRPIPRQGGQGSLASLLTACSLESVV